VAKAQMKMPEDFLLKLSKLSDKTDEIIPKVLETGGEVVLAKVKSNLHAVVGSRTKEKSRSTGELVNSLGLSPAKLDRNGNFNVKVGFEEPRRSGESNAKIANIIEYGKSGQAPKPFLKPARSASRKACIEVMKETLDKEIEKYEFTSGFKQHT
jgi:HK97 gp10 family phage protein